MVVLCVPLSFQHGQRFSNVLSLQVKPHKLLPREIGAAAAYEASIHCWEHHKSIYVQPLSEDCDREREALIGLVTAKGMSLLSLAHKPLRSPQLPHRMPSPPPFTAPLAPAGTRHRHNSDDVPHHRPPLQRPTTMHISPTTHTSQPIHAPRPHPRIPGPLRCTWHPHATSMHPVHCPCPQAAPCA